MTFSNRSLLLILSGAGLWLFGFQLGQAQIITINNPNFATSAAGWTLGFDPGVAGTWNGTTNPYGSSALIQGPSGGATTIIGAPDATAAQITMDSSDVPDPGAPYPSTVTANFPQTDPNTGAKTVRLDSSNGALGSLWQNTGVVFAANTTYTLSAYSTGQSTTGAYTGVGLSGSTPLTLSQVALNTDGFTTSTPEYSDSVSMQLVADPSQFHLSTLTIDTASPEFSGLVGQDIIVNLLANNSSYFGRPQNFTDASLTFVSDVPEPSTWVMILGGVGILAFLRQRSLKLRPVAK